MINEKVNDMYSLIDSFYFENKRLRGKIEHLEKTNEINNKSIHEQSEKTYDISKTAHKKANYNEQYSRKNNNIKILNIPEAKEDNEISL
ncbi:hypothetical protein DPMN_160239 [Dreissena polymorpha]|uniref:Uncharacterized protein n=1 Tax=Dreissena polymorpha TaxID=45954 RepID=A0A9D4EQQ9_DREPO|nr:hypothetical protein DPMN_160239 [Dreissena polymorpha]